jgi:hypothetical protein
VRWARKCIVQAGINYCMTGVFIGAAEGNSDLREKTYLVRERGFFLILLSIFALALLPQDGDLYFYKLQALKPIPVRTFESKSIFTARNCFL